MIDVFNIPSNTNASQIFYARPYSTTVTTGAGTITGSWQTWQKPRGCRFIHMLCIGSGCGGGVAGYTAGGAFGLGRGGGSAAITTAIFPADVLPNTLYVLPGFGRTPVTSSTPGNGGVVSSGGVQVHSIVAIRPITAWPDAMNVVCASGATVLGTLSFYESTITEAYAGFLALANWTSLTGQDVSVGSVPWGYNATNGDPTIITPGRPSDSTTTGTGGSITSADFGIMQTPLIAGGLGSAVTLGNATDGLDGQWFWKPVMFGIGGAGGGNSDVGFGGRGGDGGFGCGGGGGGWGALGAGRGGKGGDGLVIITAF